ncbi:MAG: L-threonylcarbamoyladenylate synthase [Nanoarchaeota archaeon]|nr:L-threonylcarbamoyladenylate synthase [Nanoarchaeota archaeon]
MRVLTKDEFPLCHDELFELINSGSSFIYPTDTIYGLGCNAEDFEAVEKIRKIKDRPEAAFSVIAPSKNWIRMHCEINECAEAWLEKLPGPYTLILPAKDGIAKNVAPGKKTLGVRMPQHWFLDIIAELGKPIVTTSANKAGDNFMTSLEDMDDTLKPSIDFMFYEGEKNGTPSTIVDLSEPFAKVIER